MTQFVQTLSLVLAAFVLGWATMFSVVLSPQAFRTLDASRAKRMIRDTMKRGHPMLAGVCGAAAAGSLLAGGFGGAVLMALAAAMFLLAAFTLSPPADDGERVPGVHRKRDTARVVAAMLTLIIILIVIAGVVLISLKI